MIVKNYEKHSLLSEEEMYFCNMIKELIDCTQNVKDCGLCFDEMKYIIDTLCTM